MSDVIKLRKGLDIKLTGKAELTTETAPTAESYALKPTDFHGLTPKLCVKADQEVKTGDSLFYDKYNPEIVFTSPVGGKIISINRGERRKILEVVIKAEDNAGSVEFKKADPKELSKEEIKEQILKSGLWPFIKKRPYGIIAIPDESPKNIYISTFDTAPLAPNYGYILEGEQETFQTGVDALAKLTEGNVIIGVDAESGAGFFNDLKNVQVNKFSGPHPAGNVGIQIHHTNPINKGDVVWTINPQDVLFIGRLFGTGKLDLSKKVALAGSEVKAPKYFSTILGANLASIISGSISSDNARIISGNVLTGKKVNADGYLGFYDSVISVIPEGDEYEFMGWATLGLNKFSASKTFISSLFPKKGYTMNANMHGGERAFVLSGQYEKLLPMDILPVHLLKSVIVNDIDKMEQLGIYEVVEEDLALCEYACTSKIKVQDTLRKGIESMIKELG